MKSKTPFRLTRAGAPLLGLTLAAAAAWAGPPQVQRSRRN